MSTPAKLTSEDQQVLNSIEKALQRRRSFIPDDTDAFRIVSGLGDGLPGIVIESFAGHWLVQTKNVSLPPVFSTQHAAERLGWRSLWWKKLDQSDKQPPQHLAGEATPHVTIKENGVSYLIDFTSGYSQGLFLDQREQRRRLIQRSRAGHRVLNLFAYTCGFSVAAATAGSATESIDLSRPYLDWGRRNFLANGLDPQSHFFCRGDSFEWLDRLAKKGNRYQAIILDPPTFIRNDKG